LLKGTVKSVPVVGGVVEAIEKTKKEETKNSPIGSVNWIKVIEKLIAKIAFVAIVLAWIYSQLKNEGLISMEEIKEMLKIITKYEVFSDLFS